MAGYTGIAAVGKSIERLLANAFLQRQPVPGVGKETKAVLIRTEDLAPEQVKAKIGDYALSILLYRVDFNKTTRATWSAAGSADGRGHLALDLHYLLTAYGISEQEFHEIAIRACGGYDDYQDDTDTKKQSDDVLAQFTDTFLQGNKF